MCTQTIKLSEYNINHNEFDDDSIDNNSFEEKNKSNKSNESNDIEIFKKHFPFYKNSRIYEDNNESHSEQTTRPKTWEKKPNVFYCKNISNKTKIGRKKSGEKTSEIKHGKTASDNIKAKIIRRFIQSNRNYLNNLYKNNPDNNKGIVKIFLRKIKTDFTKPLNNDKILEYFSKTLRQFYSSKLGDKFKKINKNYNKDNIDKLYQENKAKDIIELLNKTLEEVYEKYINKEIPEFNLYNDLNEIKEKENEGNDYIDRYEKIALKLITTYKKRKK